MLIKYRTTPHWNILRVGVVRETEKTVVLLDCFDREREEAKVGAWQCWHDTWQDAHSKLMYDARRNLESARRALDAARSRLDLVSKMKEPQD